MMEPKSVGRKLGLGVRVASQIIRDHSRRSSGQAPHHPLQETQPVRTKTRNLGRASKRFGEAIWGPFVHLGGVLWLEMTGLFFGIFAVFFAQHVYQLRHAFTAGQDHSKFILYVVITLAFTYFTFTSFYRARRKEKRAKR